MTAERASLFSYRFYARRTPGDEKPSVWCGDIDGPNVYMVSRHPLMLSARLHAWWRNRARVPRGPDEMTLRACVEADTPIARGE